MDPLAGEGLDAEASAGNSAAGIFIFLLVPPDRIVFYEGIRRKCVLAIGLGGKCVLSSEWFEVSTNDYKVPENVMEMADLLPENVHVVASNRLTPYLRLRDPSLTLEYARNALQYNTPKEGMVGPMIELYWALQEEEIDVGKAAPLAKEEECTFVIVSKSHTYNGDWEDYGYKLYHETDEFTIFVDQDYERGQDTRKWEE